MPSTPSAFARKKVPSEAARPFLAGASDAGGLVLARSSSDRPPSTSAAVPAIAPRTRTAITTMPPLPVSKRSLSSGEVAVAQAASFLSLSQRL